MSVKFWTRRRAWIIKVRQLSLRALPQGEEFARQLAQNGANLVLVARSQGKLERLANELRQEAEVKVTVIPTDLGSSDAVDRLISEVKDRGLKIDRIVNNAGLGVFENFLDTSLAKRMNQVSVNICAVVALK